MANIVLINPRFEASYWGMEYAMPLLGKKAALPTACLPLLAALTPSCHRVTVLDENVAPLDRHILGEADIVGLTGMSVQRQRMREILAECKALGRLTAVGGPWVTVRENYFGELADVVFVGEAEETWPQFLADWQRGEHVARYEQTSKTDMTQVPCPRYDTIDARQYVFGSLQISRGCPFQCEFCDIIVTFGRRPRLKTAKQVLRELEAMRQAGMSIAFIVDDNLIGNKQAIKPVLREMIAWQEANGFPMSFFAEASIDLADDTELMELLVAANIQAVFVGVETPNEASLRETKKYQNLREGGSIVEKVHRIQGAGMEVWTGMIVGFDNDDSSIFESQLEFVRQARIVHAMCGMLSAIPKTPLHQRLADEGRLDPSDEPSYGTNVIPLRMTRDELRDGYRRVMQELNDVERFFDRADSLYYDRKFRFNRGQRGYWSRHPLRGMVSNVKAMVQCLVLYCRLMRRVDDATMRRAYSRRLMGVWRARREPGALWIYMLKCAIHYHYARINEHLAAPDRPLVNTF